MSKQTKLQRIVLDLEELKDEVSNWNTQEDLQKVIDMLREIYVYEE